MADNHSLHFIRPRIIRAGYHSTVFIANQWFSARSITPSATVVISNISGHHIQTYVEMPVQVPLEKVKEGYQFRYAFPNEGQYLILIDSPKGVETLPLYALDDDLFYRRPFRGDVHMHSNRSDGKEEPADVAAACRRIGLDFMALTDHWKYAPSLEAIRAFQDVPVDLQIFPGEEVHIPRLSFQQDRDKVINSIHMVNFGGDFSVNDWIREHELLFNSEVTSLMQEIINFPSNIDKRSYAECVWCFNKIREAGGLGIFCHPYWISRYRFDIPETLANLLFEYQPYDAFELLGGYHRSEFPANHLQVARYHEERSKGKRIPIVGVSDAHGCNTGELFGWYSTLVFSLSDSFTDIKQSIMDLYSVAIESVPGSNPIAHGPFRLVRYAQFLLQEILPTHNALCQEEGLEMQAYLDGDAEALEKLQTFHGRISEFYGAVFDSHNQ